VAKDERTDEDLMAAYKAGEVAAYRVLVERHHAPIYRFCLRALRSPEAAADAAQEIFLKVVKNAPTWERKAKFTTWLYTMARNWCIDESRKARFRKTDSLNEPASRGNDGDSGDEKLDRVASELPQPDRITDNKRLRQVIDDAIAALPEEQREVFLLREVNGLQFKDIAEATGTGENTVKSRMRYAMLAMQKRLAAAGFVAGAAEHADDVQKASPRPGVASTETPTGPPLGARGPPAGGDGGGAKGV
jgi:RNA polymerase sigma-70 factor (ECF subfamily)